MPDIRPETVGLSVHDCNETLQTCPILLNCMHLESGKNKSDFDLEHMKSCR